MKAEVKREPVEYDPEDIQASKAPSMMQQMMELQPEGDSDEELSEDEQASQTTQPSAEKQPTAQEAADKKNQWITQHTITFNY